MNWTICFLRASQLRLGLDGPERVCGRPGGALHAVAVADLFVYAELGGRLTDVVEDGGPVGDGLGVAPGAEPVAERVHIRV